MLCFFALVMGCARKGGSVSDSMAAQSEREFADGDNPKVLQAVERFARDYRQAMAAAEDDEAFFSRDYRVGSNTQGRQKNGKKHGDSVLISTARTALGTPYVRGGTDMSGFDCSGFVQWTFNHVGVKLPRTAREQSQVGKSIRNVDDLRVGDIVAFRHPKRGYHTGIYVGEGKFIHSPRKRNVVRINSLDDPYFNRTFLGARRVNVTNEADMEAAKNMLASYEAEKSSKKYQAVASADRHTKKREKARRSSRVKNKREAAVRVVAERSSKDSKAQMRKASKERKTGVKKHVSSKKNNTVVSTNKKKSTKATKTAEKNSQKKGKSKYQTVAKRS